MAQGAHGGGAHADLAAGVGIHIMSDSLQRCETLGFWPEDLFYTELVRLPKAEGGFRVIALVHTLLRVWSKGRNVISRKWVAQMDMPDIWGAGGGACTSTGLAFEHSWTSEVAGLRGSTAPRRRSTRGGPTSQ